MYSEKENTMKNIITIISILIIPVLLYTIINKDSKENTAIASNNDMPTLMTFTSTMCLDCQKMKGIISEIKDDYNDRINFVSINATEKNKKIKELVSKNNVTLVPTMILMDKHNTEIKRIEGAISKEELIAELNGLCNE